MTGFIDVFGGDTLPPSEYGFRQLNFTVDTTLVWPYNADPSYPALPKILDFTCSAGVSVTLPDSTQVSTGEDFLLRNLGANTLTVKDASGVQLTQVAPGVAQYLYLKDNSTVAGSYGVIVFGSGSSMVSASALVGYGVKAIGSSLNQSHPVVTFASGSVLDSSHRASLVVSTGGASTFPLASAPTLGDDFFLLFRNGGTGTATLDPYGSELIDGQSSLQVQPGESLMLVCTGSQWYSVGYGRSVLYQFTQLTKDVSAGGTITLTAAEASNKLITFIGNPAGPVSVVVPGVVAVYYTYSSVSTNQPITLKTAGGSGVSISQGARIIALCDGTNVLSAQSAVANAAVSLSDGSATIPSLFFSSQTNTGIYKYSSQGIGFSVNGSLVGYFDASGFAVSTIGPNGTQRHVIPAVPSDTLALLAATQTLTNKTLSGSSNTFSNLPNSALTNSSFTLNGTTVNLGETKTITAASPYALSFGSGLTAGSSYTGSAAVSVSIDTSVVATLTGAQVLTNKTLNLASNTLTGTMTQFNTALTDGDFVFSTGATGSALIPSGTTAQRDVSPVNGYMRYNSTLGDMEGYLSGAWDTILRAGKVGVTVQGFDAATVKSNQPQTFSASQRGTLTTANTASYDLNLTNNFITTLAATQTLAFSNLVSGQSGNIIFINGSNYVVAKNSYVKCSSSDLSLLSTTGTYWVSYLCDGTNVYLSVRGPLS